MYGVIFFYMVFVSVSGLCGIQEYGFVIVDKYHNARWSICDIDSIFDKT